MSLAERRRCEMAYKEHGMWEIRDVLERLGRGERSHTETRDGASKTSKTVKIDFSLG